MYEVIKIISQPIIGVAGVAVAIMLFRLNIEVRKDNWAKALREFHQSFWNDDSIKEVREWIALDSSYEEVRTVFAKRNNEEPITSEEYAYLEKMDKFAALILAYKKLSPNDGWHRHASDRLFDQYWLCKLTEEKRPEMRSYVKHFYSELVTELPE